MEGKVKRRVTVPTDSVEVRLSESQMRKLAPVLAEVISRSTKVFISPSDLVSFIGQNGKVVLPQRREIESMRRQKSFPMIIIIDSKLIEPQPTPKPPRSVKLIEPEPTPKPRPKPKRRSRSINPEPIP